jgi:uncharacterized membrane protein
LLIIDKLKIGLIAGSIATGFQQIVSLISDTILHTEHNYWDYASFILYNHHHKNAAELAVSIIIQIFFSIQLGVAYSYFEECLKTKYHYIKGAMYGGTVWFTITGILFLFQITPLKTHGAFEAGWEFLIGVIFGTILSFFVNKLKAPSWK